MNTAHESKTAHEPQVEYEPTHDEAATKQALRSRIYAQRRARWGTDTPAAARREAAEAIARAGLDLVRNYVAPGGRVVTFVSMRTEPPTDALNTALASAGYEVVVPVTLDDMDLEWTAHGTDLPAAVRRADLTPEQAAHLLGPGAVADLPLLLIPGVAVDQAGNRLGRGGGCYDRTLSRIRGSGHVVVLLHEDEVLSEAVPCEAHDLPVDGVLTEKGYRALGAPGTPDAPGELGAPGA